MHLASLGTGTAHPELCQRPGTVRQRALMTYTLCFCYLSHTNSAKRGVISRMTSHVVPRAILNSPGLEQTRGAMGAVMSVLGLPFDWHGRVRIRSDSRCNDGSHGFSRT